MLSPILIANRGEIACRIIRTCRRLGIRTVALFSEADREALHVELADLALPIGAAEPARSYLDMAAILEAARRSGARAIHPGYGFLAENADFARAVEAAGIVFIGPSPEAMERVGDKAAAKVVARAAGVPTVPGFEDLGIADEELARAAERIGFPLLVKAVAGGGGRGMRRVDAAAQFADALRSARSEAQAAFGRADVILERLLERPRHIEVQVFADAQGEAVHLFERDCTLQRRHQKVIEEAPAPGLDPALRAALGRAAVAVAQAAGYRNAGTVEFLLEPDGRFWFIEMNTRLQVEHPVTEFVTGVDLVEWQIRIAAGEPLPLAQDRITLAGHAIEARLCAEDPARGFLPSAGRLTRCRFPAEGPGLRVETGVREGDRVTPFYDSMLAKLVVHGPDREAALQNLRAALDATEIAGPATNLGLLQRLAAAPAVGSMAIDTTWLDRETPSLLAIDAPPDSLTLALGAIALRLEREAAALAHSRRSPWEDAQGWRLNAPEQQSVHFADPATEVALQGPLADLQISAGDAAIAAQAGLSGGQGWAEIAGLRQKLAWFRSGDRLSLRWGEGWRELTLPAAEAGADVGAAADGRILASMPGRIVRVAVTEGQSVAVGATLLVLEAMKMEQAFTAPIDGTVTRLAVAPGDQVAEGTLLVEIEPASG